MKKKYLQFIIRLTLISLILLGAYFILKGNLGPAILVPAIPLLILLFYFITALVHFALLRITELNPRKFVSYFMVATFLKLMNYMIVIVVYVLTVKTGILAFVLTFFILYLIYTAFEVVTLLSQTKG